MTAATATAPKPAAPKAKAAAKPAAPAPQPVEAPAAPAPQANRTGNAAQAAETVRAQITSAMADLRAKGFTRPSISAATGLNDSQVWRAQNNKVHTVEVPVIMAFIEKVVNGEVKPPTAGRKPKVEDLQARIDRALATLGSEAKTAAQFKKIVADAQLVLTGDAPAEATPSA